MFIVCLDLEGIITPEVWINVAKTKNVKELRITTRDEPNYDKLMRRRLEILTQHNIKLKDIQDIVKGMNLLPGAKEFMDWLQSINQVIIVSDTFIEFAMPFMKKLGYPTLLCHSLKINENGMIIDYLLRIKDMKRITVQKFREMNYKVIAVGDSYNDINMLMEADNGILFRPPEKVLKEFSQFDVATEYSELRKIISNYLGF
ncbi:MAG: bifunctional phosphoserine phosphatase/homoserine phosphotransferase ThrH [Promethearchaeota archaeon]